MKSSSKKVRGERHREGVPDSARLGPAVWAPARERDAGTRAGWGQRRMRGGVRVRVRVRERERERAGRRTGWGGGAGGAD